MARNLDRHPRACAETPGWPYHASSHTMTSLALTLILASAFFHATWNLLAKRAGGSLTFTWLFHVVATVLCAPIAGLLILTEQPTFGLRELTAVVGSGLCTWRTFSSSARATSSATSRWCTRLLGAPARCWLR